MNNKFKKYLIKELKKADEYTIKVFEYLKNIEEQTQGYRDNKLQETIWELCEVDEIISKTIIELEVLKTNE